MKKTFTLPLCALFVALEFISCTSVREMHYFRDTVPEVPNYYRLRIRARTIFTSSRYVSGYFDEKSVTQYFGETKTSGKDSTKSSSALVPLAKGAEGSTPVMILSSNSDAIASQIGAMAENEVLTKTIAAIANRDETAREGTYSVLDDDFKTTHSQMELFMTGVLKEVDEKADSAVINSAYLQIANAAVKRLGKNVHFRNINEYKRWFNANNQSLKNP